MTEPRDVRTPDWTEPSSHPKIPIGITVYFPKEFEPGCDELESIWADVVAELTEVNFRDRVHGSRRTREAGCVGPLCLKATREHSRRRFESRPIGKYVWLDPLLEFFEQDARAQIELHEEQIKQALSHIFQEVHDGSK